MDDAAAAVATPFGSWASIRGYFTPATLFIVLNLVIGTIALTSRSHQRRRRYPHHHDDYAHPHDHAQYQAPPPPLDPLQEQHEYDYYQQQPAQYATPAPLARTSSVLDRLRSIGLYRFRSGDFPPEYGAGAAANGHHDVFPPVEQETAKQYARSRSEPVPAREERRAPRATKKPTGTDGVRKSQAARPPATRVVQAVAKNEAVNARADEDFVASYRQQEPASPPKAEYRYQQQQEEEYVPPPAPLRAPPPLSRTSSVLDRLRSLGPGLYSFLGADQPAATPEPHDAFVPAPVVSDKKQTHYDRSRSEPAREQSKKTKQQAAGEAKMAKSSSSVTLKPATALAQQPSIDTRATAFIDSFRREQSQKELHHLDEDEDEHVVPPPPAPLARTSSVLDRLRSFSLYLRSGDAVPEDPYNSKTPPPAAPEEKKQQYARSRSEPAREPVKPKKQEARLSKVSSEADMTDDAPAPAEECVDARADDFINKFRQQLQLQRLNSLLNYKEVLSRKQ